MDEQEVLRAVAVAYEYSYAHADWITPLDEVLDGISAKDAFRRPFGIDKGIWDIVLHLAAWNENIVERIQTGAKSRPAEGAWPRPPERASEEAWQAARDRLNLALAAVMGLLESTNLEQIQASPYGLADLLCRMTHNGYHIGQITKMRQILASEK